MKPQKENRTDLSQDPASKQRLFYTFCFNSLSDFENTEILLASFHKGQHLQIRTILQDKWGWHTIKASLISQFSTIERPHGKQNQLDLSSLRVTYMEKWIFIALGKSRFTGQVAQSLAHCEDMFLFIGKRRKEVSHALKNTTRDIPEDTR